MEYIYWFCVIKLVRFLWFIRLRAAAEFVGVHSGLRERLEILLSETR
jgi:hypothetical protein